MITVIPNRVFNLSDEEVDRAGLHPAHEENGLHCFLCGCDAVINRREYKLSVVIGKEIEAVILPVADYECDDCHSTWTEIDRQAA